MNLLFNLKWPSESALKLSIKKEHLLHYMRDFFFLWLVNKACTEKKSDTSAVCLNSVYFLPFWLKEAQLFLFYYFIYHLIYFFNDAKLKGCFATSDIPLALEEIFLVTPNTYFKSTHSLLLGSLLEYTGSYYEHMWKRHAVWTAPDTKEQLWIMDLCYRAVNWELIVQDQSRAWIGSG